MARLRSDFWVAAHLRRCASAGIEAVLRRRGAAEAGAIFVTVDRLDGSGSLYAPAPQSLVGEDDEDERLFACVLEAVPLADIEARLAREIRFDSDLWILEISDREGRHFLTIARD